MTTLRSRRTLRTLAQVVVALVLALIVAVSLWWGFLREHAPLATTARGIQVQANFAAMANGPAPDHFDGGQRASVVISPDGSTGQLGIQNGRLTFQPATPDSAVAYVSSPDLGSSVKGMGARFVLRPGSGSKGAISLTISRAIENRVPPMVRPLPLNLVLTAVNWNISLARTDREPLEVVAAGELPQALREDGQTVYEARVTIDGARVTVDLPGVHRVMTDPRFSEWQGSFATFGIFVNHGDTDSIAAFDKIWATGKKD